MTVRLGLDAKLYYRPTPGSGTWTELTNVKDVTLSIEKAEADVSSRAAAGWRALRGTLKEASIEFQMNDVPDDAGLLAIREAFIANDVLEFLVLNGPEDEEGSEGLKATCDVLNFSRNEALEEGIAYDVTVKPTIADDPPEWHVSAGA